MNGAFNLVCRKFMAFLVAFATGQVMLMSVSFAAPAVKPVTSQGECGGKTMGAIICNMVKGTEGSQPIFPALCYLFGLFIGVWAIAKLIEHVQNPQQVPVWEPIKKAVVAGCLFALPLVMEAAFETLVNGTGEDGMSTTKWTGSPTGGGLDAMVVALMSDTFKPMANLLMMFCYFAGVILIIIGIMRLMKSAQEGPRGPGGFGTIMTFLVAGALFSADEMMAAFSTTLFTTEQVKVGSQLTFDAGLKDNEKDHVMSVISAILAFVMVLGWISFIRGWFIIRNVAEGDQQASMMAGMTHLFGGALAINLGPVLNAVQHTFGLADVGVQFQ